MKDPVLVHFCDHARHVCRRLADDGEVQVRDRLPAAKSHVAHAYARDADAARKFRFEVREKARPGEALAVRERVRGFKALRLLRRQSLFDFVRLRLEDVGLLLQAFDITLDHVRPRVGLHTRLNDKGERDETDERDDARHSPRQSAIAKRLAGKIEISAHDIFKF